MYVKIFSPCGELMTSKDVADFANKVHQLSAKGSPFTADMFEESSDRNFRLQGHMCDCGTNENVIGNPTNGEFELFSLGSSAVREGMKAYMRCRKCGCVSHL